MKNEEISIYIHWPFCKSKCPYCDFNSHVNSNINFKAYISAYEKEILYYKDILFGKAIKSIFFGGGTPSLAPPEFFARVLASIQKLASFKPDIEITIEANPTSVEADKFKEFAALGINRASIGLQSLNDNNLKFLGREHSASEATHAIEIAARNFQKYSFDLIYALPNQSLNDWEQELNMALKFSDNHISLYQLTIEKGTKFFSDYKSGKFKLPKDDLACDMYNLTQEILETSLMPQYEISNHARVGSQSIHNLNYWQYGDYLGIGAGAHGRYLFNDKKYATVNYHLPQKWLAAHHDDLSPFQTMEIIPSNIQREERIMMGLRLASGIPYSEFEEEQYNQLIKDGLLAIEDAFLKITAKGRLVLNSVIAKLIVAL